MTTVEIILYLIMSTMFFIGAWKSTAPDRAKLTNGFSRFIFTLASVIFSFFWPVWFIFYFVKWALHGKV